MRRIMLARAMGVIGAFSSQAASWELSKRLDQNSARHWTISDRSPVIALGKNGAESGGEFADSLSGGPDYWEVTGLGANETLSLRKEPSPRAKRVAQLPNGVILKNLGCKISHSKRWCKVERPDNPSLRGWVNGRYLHESARPK